MCLLGIVKAVRKILRRAVTDNDTAQNKKKKNVISPLEASNPLAEWFEAFLLLLSYLDEIASSWFL